MNGTPSVALKCDDDHWRIVFVRPLGRCLYEVELVLGDDELCAEAFASALLAVGDRAARGTHEPADWFVRVESCDDDEACAWLSSHEHEYAIGNLCVTGQVP